MFYVPHCHVFFFSSRRRHTRWPRDWSSDVCSSDLAKFVIMYRQNGPGSSSGGSQSLGSAIKALLGGASATADNLVDAALGDYQLDLTKRSEERRVGKECRSRWSPDD